MTAGPLARTVIARWRHARLIGLGDRGAPGGFTPGLCLTADESAEPTLAPFSFNHLASSLPATLEMAARGAWAFPFEAADVPTWVADEGLVLPPSLSDADTGMGQSEGGLLPVSWQRLVHDPALLEADLSPEIVVLMDAVQLAGHPGRLVRALRLLRERFPAALLWTPGLGGPDNCAVLAWFGVDLFDLSRSRQAAAHGILLSRDGPRNSDAVLEGEADIAAQIAEWTAALAATRAGIRDGTLRELVEKQSLNSPRLVEHLRRHDAMLAEDAPLAMHVAAEQRFRCHSPVSRQDPLVADWIHRMETAYSPPEVQRETLILLPCSARKPYSSSQSHRFFRGAIRDRTVHQVIVTSPLGLVPRELENQWPAAHYDVPVTGDWDADEIATIRRMVHNLVERVGYTTVINHSGIAFPDLETIDTRPEGVGASSKAACDVLRAAVDALEGPRMREKELLRHQFAALSRWQHGNDAWLEGLRVGGKPPRWLLLRNKQQMGQWHPETGRFSFTKALLPTLHETGTLRTIHIGGDGSWNGDIFASMVESAPADIRSGEELLVMRDGTLLGSARALASGWEWQGGIGRLAKRQHRL